MKILFTFFLLSLCVGVQAAQPLIVHGKDDRIEAHESFAWSMAARAVAARIEASNLTLTNGDNFVIATTSLKNLLETYMEAALCDDVRFAKQPSAADCTGFLVAPDVLMTAGHCMQSESDCANFLWAFDYEMSVNKENPKFIKKENVYLCQSILRQSHMPDYAIIKLNRVSSRTPLKLLPKAVSAVGTELVMIGYPTGIPLKVTPNGRLLAVNNNQLVTNLDAFSGNSGSPVIDAKPGKVTGILVSGEMDYKVGSRSCVEVNVVGENQGKETVTSVNVIPRNF